MIGAIAGAALAAGGSIYSGIKSAEANRKRRLYLDNYERDMLNQTNLDKYRDWSQSNAAQAGETMLRRNYRDAIASAEGKRSVIGGTRSSVKELKDAANNATAQYASNIAVQGEQMAQQAKQQQLAGKQWVAGQRMGMQSEIAQQNAQAGSQLLQSGLGLAVADMKSQLSTGRGLFGEKFGSKNVTTKVGDSYPVFNGGTGVDQFGYTWG